jgi:hypothetical protein
MLRNQKPLEIDQKLPTDLGSTDWLLNTIKIWSISLSDKYTLFKNPQKFYREYLCYFSFFLKKKSRILFLPFLKLLASSSKIGSKQVAALG